MCLTRKRQCCPKVVVERHSILKTDTRNTTYRYIKLNALITHDDRCFFVYFKILMLSDDENKSEKTILDERQGKMLLHTEFSLLSLLTDQEGVIHHHGMFSVSPTIQFIDPVRKFLSFVGYGLRRRSVFKL